MDSFRKMQTLRRDFERLQHLMEMVKKRWVVERPAWIERSDHIC